MNSIMSKASRAMLLSFCCVAFSVAQTQRPSIAVVISLQKIVTTQHEPVLVELTFENRSDKGVVVSLGSDDEKLNVRVEDPSGEIFDKPRPKMQTGFEAVDAFYVGPGGTSTGSIVLNDWFNFDKTGKYRVEVNLSDTSSPKEAFAYNLVSDATTLNFSVRARDQKVLEARCADLLAHLQEVGSASAALTASKALSSVNDPVAVPYLAAAMKRREFASMMITALSRLKTEKAVAALIEASKSDDKETKVLARSALASIAESERR
jgi:hypothetical protein